METKPKSLVENATERVVFFKTVIRFIISIIDEFGETMLYEIHDDYARTIHELHGFGGFSFHLDANQTASGGNTLRVWHHPRLQFEDRISGPVLDISWETEIEDCTNLQFDQSRRWQRRILSVMRARGTIAKQRRAARRMA